MNGAITPLPPTSSWCAQGHFYFYCLLYLAGGKQASLNWLPEQNVLQYIKLYPLT